MSHVLTDLSPAERAVAGTTLHGGDARAVFAEALGRAEAGGRVTAPLTGGQLVGALDLLAAGAARMLPLVVRTDLGAGDAALFAAADRGVTVLCGEAAEAPLLHLIARLLAERALQPVVVATGHAGAAAALPQSALTLLGDEGDAVPCATPAQEQWFGRERRRVVRWFDHERPVLRGQPADDRLEVLRRSGDTPFVRGPVVQLLDQVLVELRERCGLSWSRFVLEHTVKAEALVVGLAGATPTLAGDRIGVVRLGCLRPFADEWLGELRKKRAAVVLCGSDGAPGAEPPLLREVRAALGRRVASGHGPEPKASPSLHAAIATAAVPQAADVLAFVRECLTGRGCAQVWLGVTFAPLGGPGDNALPKRRVLHEALRRAHPGLERLGVDEAPHAQPRTLSRVPASPLRVPPPARPGATHDDLTRCWDVIGAAAISGADQALSPDPYLTLGSAPALTSLLRGNAAEPFLPALDAARCTGCGACWTACPDAALLPSVLPARMLLEHGLKMATAAGADAAALQPVLGALAKGMRKAVVAGAVRADEALAVAAETALARVADERRAAAAAALRAVIDALRDLPVGCPAPFAGSGTDLFVLSLDPDACKGCGLCVAACEPDALTMVARDDAAQATARGTAATWRALPDTAGAVVAAARELPEPGVAGALQLTRACALAMAPGDDAEPGSGARIALRTVLAAAEAHLQPLLQRHLQQLDGLGATFGERIREQLTGALPAGDLEALHEGLQTIGQGRVALSTLAGRLDEVQQSGRVDAGRLQLLVETARAVADLRWRIAQAHSGRGRARAGVVLTGGVASELGARFPWNPFAQPAVFDDSGEAGLRAVGLMRGVADAAAADFALLRRADALLKQCAPGPRQLVADELTADERALLPPLWLVADAAAFAGSGLRQLGAVLSSELPIKVLLVTSGPAPWAELDAALLALANRDAYVAQSSVAHRDHLTRAALAASAHQGPALLHVLAPSPRACEVAADATLQVAAAAVQRRAFPLFDYDPARAGAFGQKLSLAGNPAAGDDGEHCAGWRTLQELAGVLTPFTADVERKAAEAVRDQHERELAALRQQHEAALRAARGEVEQELLARLQKKLVALSGGRTS